MLRVRRNLFSVNVDYIKCITIYFGHLYIPLHIYLDSIDVSRTTLSVQRFIGYSIVPMLSRTKKITLFMSTIVI